MSKVTPTAPRASRTFGKAFVRLCYQPTGERQKPRTALYHPAKATEPRAFLEARLGPLARFEIDPPTVDTATTDPEKGTAMIQSMTARSNFTGFAAHVCPTPKYGTTTAPTTATLPFRRDSRWPRLIVTAGVVVLITADGQRHRPVEEISGSNVIAPLQWARYRRPAGYDGCSDRDADNTDAAVA